MWGTRPAKFADLQETMFIAGPSSMALLHAAVSICRLPYASLITEIADDSTILCGVELELPQLELLAPRQQLFLWEPAISGPIIAFEKACLRAISFLQIFYGLKVTNYYYNNQIIYREICLEQVIGYKINPLPDSNIRPLLS